jgi:hypothetical protein
MRLCSYLLIFCGVTFSNVGLSQVKIPQSTSATSSKVKKEVPKTAATSSVSRVAVKLVWEGEETVVILLDNQEITFRPKEEKIIQLRAEKALELMVRVPGKTYSAKEFVLLSKEKNPELLVSTNQNHAQFILGHRLTDLEDFYEDVFDYFGEVLNDKPHGKGIAKYRDGDQYEGSYLAGNKNGYGIYTYRDGTIYKGYFKDDLCHGKGTMIWPNGLQHIGDFLEGEAHGKGIRIYPNGDQYEGDWIDSRKNGKGICKYADGSIYDGYWVNGKRHGRGSYTVNGNKFEGDWVSDYLTQGVFTMPDGHRYEGEFSDGDKKVKGTCWYPDGQVYSGEWVDWERTGYGKLVDSTGKLIYEGNWKNDQRVP